MSDTWSFETRQIHAGQTADTATHARALPIDQTTAYTFDSAEHAADLFALKQFGNIYTRIMNPTPDAVEQRIASLEGGVGALLLASGQAAETIALLNPAQAGDHLVSSARSLAAPTTLFQQVWTPVTSGSGRGELEAQHDRGADHRCLPGELPTPRTPSLPTDVLGNPWRSGHERVGVLRAGSG